MLLGDLRGLGGARRLLVLTAIPHVVLNSGSSVLTVQSNFCLIIVVSNVPSRLVGEIGMTYVNSGSIALLAQGAGITTGNGYAGHNIVLNID